MIQRPDDSITAALELSRERKSTEALARAGEALVGCDAALRPLAESCLALVRWRADTAAGKPLASGLEEAIAGVSTLREAGYEPVLGWALANIGYALGLLGDFEAGLEWLDHAIADAKQRDDRRQLIQAYSHTGSLLAHADEIDRAFELFSQALAMCDDGLAPGRAAALNNLAYCQILRARRPGASAAARAEWAGEALAYATEALHRLDAPDLAGWRGGTLANVGAALSMLGRQEEAEAAFRQGLALSRSNPRLDAELKTDYAGLLVESGRYGPAASLLAEAAAVAPTDLVDQSSDRILELQIRLAELSGRLAEVPALWERRFQQAQGRYRDRLRNVRRHAQIFAELTQARTAERQARAQAETLRRSEERLRMAQEGARVGIWEWDGATDDIHCSPECERMYGFAAGARHRKDAWRGRVHPDDLPRFDAQWECPGGQGGPFEVEFRCRLDSGETRWMLNKGSVQCDDSGRPLRIAGISLDITERKGVEAESRQRAHILEVAQDAAHMGYFVTDVRTGTWGGSAMLDDIMGIDAAYERTIATWSALVHPDDRERATQEFFAALQQRKRLRHQYRIVRPRDGRLCWVDAWGAFEFDGDQPVRLIGTVKDVTERKLAEVALSEREHRLRFLLTATPVVIYTCRPAGDFGATFVSDNVERALGYKASDFVADASFWSSRIHPDDLERVVAGLGALATSDRYGHEYRFRHRNGEYRWMQDEIQMIRDAAGRRVEMIGSWLDITERKTAELAANAANAAKSQFLAHMSHEIRTPMNVVLGLAQLLKLHPQTPDQPEIVERILDAGGSMMQIINDILDFSRIEAGQLRVERQPFDLRSLLARVEALLRGMAEGKGLRLAVGGRAASLERLLGDAPRLEQVLVNLVGNAIKFTDRGGVEVAVEPLPSPGRVRRLRFDVHDTGIGIAPDVLGQLFTPFTQGDARITRRFGGTGLGLAICKRIVEEMGGTLGVTSTPGAGSTFWFEIPFEPAGAERGDAAAPPAPAAPPDRALAGMRILAVDDNAMNQLVVERLLQRAGAAVTLAADGLQALQVLAAQPRAFDAVLMDVQMPVMDGLTATRAIRDNPDLAGLPVIALTAGVLAEERAAALAAGVDGFVAKPIDAGTLSVALAAWSRAPAAEGAAQRPG